MFKLMLEIFRAIAEVFRFINKKNDLKNTPDVKDAQKKQDEVNKINQIEKAVKDKDVKQAQNDWSE